MASWKKKCIKLYLLCQHLFQLFIGHRPKIARLETSCVLLSSFVTMDTDSRNFFLSFDWLNKSILFIYMYLLFFFFFMNGIAFTRQSMSYTTQDALTAQWLKTFLSGEMRRTHYWCTCSITLLEKKPFKNKRQAAFTKEFNQPIIRHFVAPCQ